MTHFKNSSKDTIKKTVSTGRVVKCVNRKAAGTEINQAKQLSKIKVMAVLPPDRMIK